MLIAGPSGPSGRGLVVGPPVFLFAEPPTGELIRLADSCRPLERPICAWAVNPQAQEDPRWSPISLWIGLLWSGGSGWKSGAGGLESGTCQASGGTRPGASLRSFGPGREAPGRPGAGVKSDLGTEA